MHAVIFFLNVLIWIVTGLLMPHLLRSRGVALSNDSVITNIKSVGGALWGGVFAFLLLGREVFGAPYLHFALAFFCSLALIYPRSLVRQHVETTEQHIRTSILPHIVQLIREKLIPASRNSYKATDDFRQRFITSFLHPSHS